MIILLISIHLLQAQSGIDRIGVTDSLNEACKSNWFTNTNLAIELGTKAIEEARSVGYGDGLSIAYNNLGVAFWVRGEPDRALDLYYKSINVRDSIGGALGLGNTYHNIGNIFKDRKDYTESKKWFNKALDIRYPIHDSLGISYSINNLGLIAQLEGNYDSASYFLNKSLAIREALQDSRGIATSHMSLGKLNIALNNFVMAEKLYLQALGEWEKIQHFQGQADTYIELAKLYQITDHSSKQEACINKGIALALKIEAKPQLLQLYELSTEYYLTRLDTISAFSQLQKVNFYRSEIYNEQRESLIQQYNQDQIAYSNDLLQKQNQLQKEQILRQKDREKTIVIFIALLVVLTFLLYRLLITRVKTNKALTLRNEELNKTLLELKRTQSQLIQSEKMASLGTLTSGVSHEINNPLNFVMGAYHLLSMQLKSDEEMDKETVHESLDALNVGIERISNIVKGLNQISRNNDNMEEICDIHQIIDNSVLMLTNQLKKKAVLTKMYENEPITILGNISKLHQVFLNVLSNAIHAIMQDGSIKIATQLAGSKAKIEIIDDGIGIEADDIDRITDPFFTTKSPGEGTGLGLAIVNSIIMDHHGSITFKSKVKKGTTVTIELPVQ